MTLHCEDRELLEGFLAESTELLEKIDDDLVSLEQAPDDKELLNRIFRSIHTVKGAASFLEFELLVQVTHQTEDVLNRLRKGELTVRAAIMDIILEAVDLVKLLINDIKADDIRERPVQGIIDRLVAVVTATDDPDDDAAAPSPAAVPSCPAPDTAATAAPRDRAACGDGSAARKSGEELSDKSTVRVDVKRVDELMNQVGELVLERNRMIQLNSDFQNETNMARFGEEFAKLSKRLDFVTSEVQMQVLKMRLVPVSNVFKKFPRIVRNLSRDLGKQVDLQISGEDTELDRSVVDEIGDPLIHLLRNAMDHGLETPEERVASGKHQAGTIRLSAHHEGNQIIISISDDGRGIDAERVAAKALDKNLVTAEQLADMNQREILDFIFLPGFSTKEKTSDLSGRGVGMDVVRTNIKKLNGIIEIKSEKGSGSRFILKLPLTLAIIQSLLVEVWGEIYSIPLSAVVETLRVSEEEFYSINGRKVLKLKEAVLPLLNLADLFGIASRKQTNQPSYVVVVGSAEKRLGLVVTRLLGQQEIAIKSLGNYLANVPGIAGSTIMGDGRVALIVDPARLVELRQ